MGVAFSTSRKLSRFDYRPLVSQGKLVADAQHAAVALEHGCTLVTRDADFEVFRSTGLRLEILQPE